MLLSSGAAARDAGRIRCLRSRARAWSFRHCHWLTVSDVGSTSGGLDGGASAGCACSAAFSRKGFASACASACSWASCAAAGAEHWQGRAQTGCRRSLMRCAREGNSAQFSVKRRTRTEPDAGSCAGCVGLDGVRAAALAPRRYCGCEDAKGKAELRGGGVREAGC